MSRLKALLIFTTVLILAGSASALAGERIGTNSDSVHGTVMTTSQVAAFAAFLAASPEDGLDTAISISNVTNTFPEGFATPFIDLSGADDVGTLEFYLWNLDGTLTVYETDADTPGNGLSEDGTLASGASYSVLLSDLYAAAIGDGTDPAGEEGPMPLPGFSGYAIIIGNFDGMIGTYNPVAFGVGFSTSYVLSPAAGQGTHGTASLPIYTPMVDPIGN